MSARKLLDTLLEAREALDRQIETVARIIDSEGQSDIEDDKAGGLKLMVVDTLKGGKSADMGSDEAMAERQRDYLRRLGIRTPRQ